MSDWRNVVMQKVAIAENFLGRLASDNNWLNHTKRFLRKNESIRYVGAVIVFALVVALMFPLEAIWLLACAATLYPGYKLVCSYQEDRKAAMREREIERETKAFVQAAIVEKRPVALPIRYMRGTVDKEVLIIGETADGLNVRDPHTKIDAAYAWEDIDFAVFYARRSRGGGAPAI